MTNIECSATTIATSQQLLGIAIPAYKRESLLRRLLDSIGNRCPVVVSDNGGHLSEQLKADYPHVHFLSGPEVPVLDNWNRAARALDTEWIVMPGDDDLYYPESFEIIEDALRRYNRADMVLFGHHLIDEQDRVISSWVPQTNSLSAPQGFQVVRRGTPARPPGIVFKADLFNRLGGFCTAFQVTAGDNDFYQRGTLIGHLACVDQIVTGYRVWDSGSTHQSITTVEWMREIDLWCNRVREIAGQLSDTIYPKSLQDDIYFDNLLAGIRTIKKGGGYRLAWKHFFRSRYPWRTSVANQLRLMAYLMIPERT